MEKISDKTTVGVIIILSTILLIFTLKGSIAKKERQSVEGSTEFTLTEKKEENESEEGAQEICVYICGAIKKPGIYKFDKSSRINNAIEAAGGLTENADLNKINLARKLKDEDFIRIAEKGEEIKQEKSHSTKKLKTSEPFTCEKLEDSEPEEIILSLEPPFTDINNATQEDLVKIPGVGSKTAEKILKYREEHGFITNIDEIEKIPGIKKRSLSACRKYLLIGEQQ